MRRAHPSSAASGASRAPSPAAPAAGCAGPPASTQATGRPYAWIYLASQSPRRRQLLDQLGVPHRLLLPAPGEDAEALEVVRPGEAPARYVQRVTCAKLAAACARWAAAGLPPAPILCADTTVALGRQIFGKPADAAEAQAILTRLAGATHRVLTAVAVAWPDDVGGTVVQAALNTSQVRFAAVDAAEIAAYVASGEPMGKAGAYAIQSAAAAWISHIRGSYSGIMGLPLFETAGLLRAAGRFTPAPTPTAAGTGPAIG